MLGVNPVAIGKSRTAKIILNEGKVKKRKFSAKKGKMQKYLMYVFVVLFTHRAGFESFKRIDSLPVLIGEGGERA